MIGWHHGVNRHELGQTPGERGGQRGLACCCSEILSSAMSSLLINPLKTVCMSESVFDLQHFSLVPFLCHFHLPAALRPCPGMLSALSMRALAH